MRISKNNDDEGLKTFNTIALRDQAIESFDDGDLIKVLDASGDPEIQSGWAIYRFQESSKSFDLIEKEEVEKIEMIEPDYITTTDGVDPVKNIITSPMLFSAIDRSLEILQDFDFDISVDAFGRIVFAIQGLQAPNVSLNIPINTIEGRKYLRLGIGQLRVHFAMQENYMHWHISTQVVDEDDPSQFQILSVNTQADGKCLVLNDENNGIDNNGYIPLMIVRCEKDINGNWDNQKLSVFKLWEKNLAVPAPAEEVKQTALDNKTIVLDSSDKLAAFHNFNHGAGFEFPSKIDVILDDLSYTDLKIKWTGFKGDLDTFKFESNSRKLELRDLTFTTEHISSFLGDNNFVYIKISHHLGLHYLDLDVDFSSTLPSCNSFRNPLGTFLPIVIAKVFFYPDYETLDLSSTQICRIFKNGTLIEGEAEVPELPEFVDDKTIIRNEQDKIVSFQDLNQGAGFEFPSNVCLKLDTLSNPSYLFADWSGVNTGVDVFRYKDVEYKLGLSRASFGLDYIGGICSGNGGFCYIKLSCHAGFVYWSSDASISTTFPSLNPFDKRDKLYVPVAIIKLVMNPDNTIDLVNTQTSHIYRNGILIKSAVEEVEPVETKTPTLDEVLKEGNETGEKIVIKRDSMNNTAIEVQDLEGKKKIGFHMLNEAGQIEFYNKLNQIGLSFDGEGNIVALRRIKAKAFCMNNEAAKGAVATCLDNEGNFVWEIPTTPYPDGNSADYSTNRQSKLIFAVPDAVKCFRSDMRILKDFDFDISIDYNTVKLDLVGERFQDIPIKTKDGVHIMTLMPIEFEMDRVWQGKTIYIPVFKRVHAIRNTDAYYLGNASEREGVTAPQDTTTKSTQLVMQLKVNVPTDWNLFTHSDITLFKSWKKSLGTFDELMDYRIANP
jgi:hypothetical protein